MLIATAGIVMLKTDVRKCTSVKKLESGKFQIEVVMASGIHLQFELSAREVVVLSTHDTLGSFLETVSLN